MQRTSAGLLSRQDWLVSFVLAFLIPICAVGAASPDAGGVQVRVQDSIVEIVSWEYDSALKDYAYVVKGLGVVRWSPNDEHAAQSEIVTTAELGEHHTIRYGGRLYMAQVAYLDKDAGIAVLHVWNMASKAAETRNTEVNIGERVYAVGLANGANTVQETTVSLKVDLKNKRNSLLQTPLQGPILGGTGVFDVSGRLVGITTLRHEAKGQASKHVAISAASLQTVDEFQRADIPFGTWGFHQGSEAERALLDSHLLVHDWLRTAKSERGQTMFQEVMAFFESETYKKKEKEGYDKIQAWEAEQVHPIVRRFLRDQGMAERVASSQEPVADDVYLSCVVDAPTTTRGTLVSIIFSEDKRSLNVQGKPASSVEFTRAFINAYVDNRWLLTVSRSSGRFSWSPTGSGTFSGDCEVVSKTKF